MVAAENAAILAAMDGASAGSPPPPGPPSPPWTCSRMRWPARSRSTARCRPASSSPPQTLATARKCKASTAGSYYLDPTEPGPTSIHGIHVIATPNLAPGTAWVIQTGACIIYRRGPVTVEMGLSTNDFVRNMSTLRAEERMGTAVVRAPKIDEGYVDLDLQERGSDTTARVSGHSWGLGASGHLVAQPLRVVAFSLRFSHRPPRRGHKLRFHPKRTRTETGPRGGTLRRTGVLPAPCPLREQPWTMTRCRPSSVPSSRQ